MNPESQEQTSWQPPPLGVIKINTDVGLPANSSDSWISMVVRDSSGSCVWWSKKRIIGRPKPVDGEAQAILHGLNIAVVHGWRNIVVESDCKQLISCRSRPSRSLASFRAIVDACPELSSFFHSICFCFIRRSGNLLAHRLATLADIPCLEAPIFLRKLLMVMNK